MENHALNLARDLRARPNPGGTCRLCGYHHSANVCPPGKPDKGGGKGNNDKKDGGGGGGKKGGDGGGDKKDCGGGGGGGGKKDSGGGGDKKDPKKAIPPKKNEPPNPRPPCVPPAGGGGGGGPDPPDNSGSNADIIPPNISDALCYIVFVFIILAAVVLFYCRGLPSSKSCFGGGKPCKTGSKSDCCAAKTASKSLTSSKLQEQYENFKKSLASQACLSGYAANCPRVPNYAGVVAGARLVSIRDTKNIFSCKCKDSGKVGEVCYPNSGSCSNCKCDEEMKPEVIIQEGGPIVAGKCWAFAGKGKVLIGLYYPIIVTGITLHHPDRALLIPGYFSSAPKTFELWGYKNITDPKPHQFGTFEYAEKDAPVKMYEVQKPADGVFYNYVQFNFLTNHGNKNFTAVYRVEVHGLADT